jgi:hypothetical protein
MLLNICSFCTTHKFSVSTGFTEQIMPILRILCYNGSLVTWTVVGLTTAKFNSVLYHLYSLKAVHRKPIRCPAMDKCEPHRKHLFCCQQWVFIGPLPSNLHVIFVLLLLLLLLSSSSSSAWSSSLLRCYKLPCFVLCVCLFLSFTRAHFVIGSWAVELGSK